VEKYALDVAVVMEDWAASSKRWGSVPPLAHEVSLVLSGEFDADIAQEQFVARFDNGVLLDDERVGDPQVAVVEGEAGEQLEVVVGVLLDDLDTGLVAG